MKSGKNYFQPQSTRSNALIPPPLANLPFFDGIITKRGFRFPGTKRAEVRQRILEDIDLGAAAHEQG